MTLRPCVPGAQQGMSLPQVTARGLIPHLQLSKLLHGAWESPGGSLPTLSEPRVHTGVKPSLGNGGHCGVWGPGQRTLGLHWLGPGSGWKTLAQSCRNAGFLPRVRGSARLTTSRGHHGPFTKIQLGRPPRRTWRRARPEGRVPPSPWPRQRVSVPRARWSHPPPSASLSSTEIPDCAQH